MKKFLLCAFIFSAAFAQDNRLQRMALSEVQALRMEIVRIEVQAAQANLEVARMKVERELDRLSRELGIDRERLVQMGPESKFVVVKKAEEEKDEDSKSDSNSP